MDGFLKLASRYVGAGTHWGCVWGRERLGLLLAVGAAQVLKQNRTTPCCEGDIQPWELGRGARDPGPASASPLALAVSFKLCGAPAMTQVTPAAPLSNGWLSIFTSADPKFTACLAFVLRHSQTK